MAKKILTIKLKTHHMPMLLFIAVAVVFMSGIVAFFSIYYARVYPGVFVDGINIGGLTREQAETKLKAQMTMPEKIDIDTNSGIKSLEVQSFSAMYDIEASVAEAYGVGREGDIYRDTKDILKAIIQNESIPPKISIDDAALTEQATLATLDSEALPAMPSVALENGLIIVNKGKPGYEVDLVKLKASILASLVSRNVHMIQVEREFIDPTLSEDQVEAVKARAHAIVSKTIILTFEHTNFEIDGRTLISTINPQNGFSLAPLAQTINDIQAQIEREPKNPVFNFESGRVVEFSPATNGITLKRDALLADIKDALEELASTDTDVIELAVATVQTPPPLKTEDVNNLGIKELIGRGTSKFKGSIPSRVHNVALAASRINGTLVAPGETFSFNSAVGDISALSGYKQSYVIQGNQTVLGDGGGVCQVSTTVFRAALDAGLPITERHPHSYRVGYYEQDSPPGIDATIYSPGVDLKIKNDTPGHILIQAIADTKSMTLAFEIYGTSDGRVSSISKPVVSNVTPPPEDLYIDDPNLPIGTVEHIDYKAWGARVSFDYSVERDGESIFKKTFVSSYKPWQAKYLRGTGPSQ